MTQFSVLRHWAVQLAVAVLFITAQSIGIGHGVDHEQHTNPIPAVSFDDHCGHHDCDHEAQNHGDQENGHEDGFECTLYLAYSKIDDDDAIAVEFVNFLEVSSLIEAAPVTNESEAAHIPFFTFARAPPVRRT